MRKPSNEIFHKTKSYTRPYIIKYFNLHSLITSVRVPRDPNHSVVGDTHCNPKTINVAIPYDMEVTVQGLSDASIRDAKIFLFL